MGFKKSVLLFFSLQIPLLCFAEYRDPTKPAYYSAELSTNHKQSELNLSSIWISDRSRRVTINGITAKQGETIFSDVKIIQILKNAVIIEQNGQRSKLTLLTRSYKTR